MQAHIVPCCGGAVFFSAGHSELELARQKSELWVQRAPLAQYLAKRSRVGNFIGRYACQLVAGNVANAVAAGLNAVHVHAGQQVHHIGAFV